MNLPPSFVPQIPDDLRMQANDLLSHCIATGQAKPLYQVVENLLLVGPSAFYTLNALLRETSQRRAQIEDEIHRAIGTFYNNVYAASGLTAEQFDRPFFAYETLQFEYRLYGDYLYELDWIASDITSETFSQLTEYHAETSQKLDQLAKQYQLCVQLENYLEDWLWGMAYQTVQHLHAIPLAKSSHIVL